MEEIEHFRPRLGLGILQKCNRSVGKRQDLQAYKKEFSKKLLVGLRFIKQQKRLQPSYFIKKFVLI
jgi:hypothetical protein